MKRIVAAVALAALLPAPVGAQVVMEANPDGTTPPLPDEVPLVDGKVPFVWATADRLEARDKPAAAERVNDRLKFMQRCVPASTSRDGRYVLLVEVAEASPQVVKPYGWVESARLLRKPEALVSRATRIHRKAACVITPAVVRAAGPDGQEAPQETALTWQPGGGEPKVRVKFFQPFFVYAEAGAGKDVYLLLGTAPDFAPGRQENATDTLLGWVRADRAEQWDTREGVYYDTAATRPGGPRNFKTTPTRPARIYGSREDAYAALAPGADVGAIFSELPDPAGTGAGVEMEPGQMRYLVLPWLPPRGLRPGERDPHPQATRHPHPDGGTAVDLRLLRVGAYGGHTALGNDPNGVAKVEEFKRQARELAEQVRRLEVLFVIDDSKGMEPWITHVLPQFISTTFDKLVASKHAEVYVGFAFYHDVAEGQDPRKALDVSRARLRDLRQSKDEMLAELRAHKTEQGHDPPERVFRGLAAGVQKAGFTQFSRKIVFLIGDMGNSTRGDVPGNRSPTAKEVADQLVPLKKGGSQPAAPAEFYAVQVNYDPADPSPGLPAEDAAAVRAFKAEADEILGHCRANLAARGFSLAKEDGRPAGGYFYGGKDTEVKPLLGALDARFAAIDAARLELEQLAVDRSRGIVRPANSRHEKELDQYYREMKLYDAYVQFLKKPGAQVFQVGYLWDKDPRGVTQVRPWLMLRQGELQVVAPALLKFAPKSQQTGVTGADPPLDDIRRQVVETQIGELQRLNMPAFKELAAEMLRQGRDPRDATVRDVLNAQVRGLEFTSRWVNGGGDLSGQEQYELYYKGQLLTDLLEGKAYRYTRRQVPYNGVQVTVLDRDGESGTKDQRDRFFYLGGERADGTASQPLNREVKWFWIDKGALWP